MTSRIRGTLTTGAIALSTALVIITASLVPLLNPWWVSFEQGRAQAAAWTGYTPVQLREATDAILADLVFGPPDFDVAVGGVPVLTETERGHMRDVHSVFLGLWALTALAAVTLVLAARTMDRSAFRAAVRRGAAALALGVVAAGAVGLVAFDLLFETFHRVVFPGGNWAFDPRTDRLVQLFPYQFWFETALVAGATMILLSGLLILLSRLSSADEAGARARTPRPAGDPVR